jgi:hypothetical protein
MSPIAILASADEDQRERILDQLWFMDWLNEHEVHWAYRLEILPDGDGCILVYAYARDENNHAMSYPCEHGDPYHPLAHVLVREPYFVPLKRLRKELIGEISTVSIPDYRIVKDS